MFCKWCGNRIVNIGNPCPSCGKNQDPLENGNGFWDLCSKDANAQPINTDTSVKVSTKDSETQEPSKCNKAVRSSAKSKSTKRLRIGAWTATCALMVIAIILIGIGVGRIRQCLSDISTLRSDINKISELITNEFAQLEKYHFDGQNAPETQSSKDTEKKTEEEIKIDIDILLEETIVITDDEALNIERYENENVTTKCVYMATGQLLKVENAKFFWQKSINQGDTWETISEDTFYIIAEMNDTDTYRIICVVTDDSEDCNVYCASTVVFDDAAEFQADNPTSKSERH